MFAEPARTQGDVHFNLLGFPVRIHPMFWLISLMFGTGRDIPPQYTLIWVVSAFVCILFHELGHARAMRRFGFDARIVLHGFGGLAIADREGPFARQTRPMDEILISLAGPGAGFLLAAVLFVAFKVAGHGMIELEDPLHVHFDFLPSVTLQGHLYLQLFINDIFWICVFWGLVNLLPVFPLDGGQVAHQMFVLKRSRDAFHQTFVVSVTVSVIMVALAVVYWRDWYIAVFFGLLAYMNYSWLHAYQSGGRWE